MIEPIKKIMIHSQAAEIIEKYIYDNNLLKGAKLPSERVLASKLGIGRNSLREAIRTLEATELIEVINGRGIFVNNVNKERVIDIKIVSAKVNFLELLDVRRTLETRGIELSTKNITNSELKLVEKALTNLEKEYNNGIYSKNSDTEFHHTIYRNCGNKTLFQLIKPIASSFDELWETFNGKESEVMGKTLPLHRKLFEAIKKESVGEAKDVFDNMIKIVEKEIIEFTK